MFRRKKEAKEPDYPKPRPEAPPRPRPDIEKRLNNLKNRQKEMVGEVCEELTKKTKNLDVDWNCKNTDRGYEYRAYIGWGSQIVVKETASHITIRLIPNRNYVNQCFLDVDFYEGIGDFSAPHLAAKELLKTIKQQPDILEKHFEVFMHEIRRDWPDDDIENLNAAPEEEDETEQDEH